MGANYEVRGDVAVISLDNPPVNGLGYDTRLGIVNGLERALDDAAVKAIVVTGAGKAFSGGADIREFGSPKAIAEPNLLVGDRRARGEPEAGRRRGAQRGDGRRPRARPRLPLPRRRARRADRPARSEDRPHSRRRRHAAAAARPRRRDRAQHDRQRRAGEERAAGEAAGPEAVRQDRRGRRRRRGRRLRAREGRRAAAAEGARPEDRLRERRRLLPVRPQHGRRDGEELPGAAEVRRGGGGVAQDEVRRRPEVRARALPRPAADAGGEGAAPPLHGRARRQQDRRRAGRHGARVRSGRSR